MPDTSEVRTMTDLNEYLGQKRPAFRALKEAAAKPDYAPTPLRARVTAEGRSGIRRIRIRDFQVLSDSPPSFVGYDIGPSSPELALGALGSCLTHSFLIQAAVHELPLDSLEVEVTGRIDARAGSAGHEDVPVYPHDIAYTVRIVSPASEDDVATVREAVERSCPILNLLRHPQTLAGRLEHSRLSSKHRIPKRSSHSSVNGGASQGDRP